MAGLTPVRGERKGLIPFRLVLVSGYTPYMPYAPPVRWVDVPGAVRAALAAPFVKVAEGEDPGGVPGSDGIPGVRNVADLAGWRAGGPVSNFFGGPRPVTSTIVGAALGGLGGYGLGRLAEIVLPKKYFNEGAVRRRAAALGAALGAIPGVWQATDNVRATGELGSVFDRWPTPPEAVKSAADLFQPIIDRDRFNQDVMADQATPMPIRAATAGLVEAAASTSGSNWVSPWDVARISLGAGAGFASGVVAGKALGFLAGLNEAGQAAVKNVGLWSGLLSAVVPKALGLR